MGEWLVFTCIIGRFMIFVSCRKWYCMVMEESKCLEGERWKMNLGILLVLWVYWFWSLLSCWVDERKKKCEYLKNIFCDFVRKMRGRVKFEQWRRNCCFMDHWIRLSCSESGELQHEKMGRFYEGKVVARVRLKMC